MPEISSYHIQDLQSSTVEFYQNIFPALPHTELRVCVIIPVKDEEDHIEQTLQALLHQRTENNSKVPFNRYEVLLLANNCSDESFSIATQFKLSHPSFHLHLAELWFHAEQANIGTARKLLMDIASKRFKHLSSKQGIIASTDGDTIVSHNWICNIIAEIDKGVDAVGGRISSKFDNTCGSAYYKQSEIYQDLVSQLEYGIDPQPHDPWPHHQQFFGANLALTAKMYAEIGGLPSRNFLEDNALFDRLKEQDARIRRSERVLVTTSGRTNGRVEVGFSEQLRKWAEMENSSQPMLVPAAAGLSWKFRCRNTLRNLYTRCEDFAVIDESLVSDLAINFSLTPAQLTQELHASQTFGKLWRDLSIRGRLNERVGLESVDCAISSLRKILRDLNTFQ